MWEWNLLLKMSLEGAVSAYFNQSPNDNMSHSYKLSPDQKKSFGARRKGYTINIILVCTKGGRIDIRSSLYFTYIHIFELPMSQKLKNLGDLSTLNLSLFYLLDVLPQWWEPQEHLCAIIFVFRDGNHRISYHRFLSSVIAWFILYNLKSLRLRLLFLHCRVQYLCIYPFFRVSWHL